MDKIITVSGYKKIITEMSDAPDCLQVEIYTSLLTFSLLLRKILLCRPKKNPDMSRYFHVNFIPCLIALLITQSAHPS